MPRINLLPAKKLARQEELGRELRIAGLGLLGFALLLLGHAWAQQRHIDDRRDLVANLEQQATLLADKVKQIESFKQDLKLIGQKLAVIDTLKQNKQGPSRLLGALAEALSEHPRVWLTRLEQQDDTVRLFGNAMSQEDISHFQMALSKKAPLLQNVTLLLVNAAKDAAERVLEWSMSCKTDLSAGAKAT